MSPHKLNRKYLQQGYTSNSILGFNHHTRTLHLQLNYKNNVT